MRSLLIRMGLSTVSMVVVIGLLTSACASSTQNGSSSAPSSSPAKVTYTLGHFPDVPTGHLPTSTEAALQAVLKAAVAQGLPGVTATVLTADRGAWSGAAGTADGVHPLVTRSQFGIGSNTKTVIAAEIMWLAEQGKLHLGDPVSEHLPSGFHFKAVGVTIKDLLSMQSGIPDPQPPEGTNPVLAHPLRRWTPEEVLGYVPAFRNKPGDHFVYEDANYMLLGLVVEHETGMGVAAALRQHILADPQLSSMVYQPEERPKGPLALPFLDGTVRPNILKLGGGYLPTASEASSANGSGGMASDSPALARWGYLLFGRHLLSQASLKAMTAFGPNLGDNRYGMGVFDQTRLDAGFGTLAVGNGGEVDGGYSSALTILPSKGVVISVLTNTAGDPVTLVFPVVQKLAATLQR